MSSSAKPRFSEGTDEASASPALSALLSGSWVLAKDGEALERSFKFKTFAKTWVPGLPSLTLSPLPLADVDEANPPRIS